MASTAFAPSLLDNNATYRLHSSRTDSSLQRKATMFNSLKDKLKGTPNRGDALPSDRGKAANLHPHISTTPSTRRPANLPNINNPFRDMGEAPPPYSADIAASIPAASRPGPQRSPSPAFTSSSSAAAATQLDNDPYAFLSSFDTIILVDDSGSMAGGRWRETKEALEAITPVCTAHDADGIDIYFLNCPDNAAHRNVTSKAGVDAIFSRVRPGGSTPTGQKLNAILKPYLARYKDNPDGTKPINLICITDGEPSDDVESPLIQAAKKLDKLDAPAWQVGVQFFQVGNDAGAKAHLKQLDDELGEIAGDEDMRDVVDTVPFKGEEGGKLTGDGVLKVVLGSVLRRLDRKTKDIHM